MIYVGIDPGTSGVLCAIDSFRQVVAMEECPTLHTVVAGKTKMGNPKHRTVVNINAVVQMLRQLKEKYTDLLILVEKVHPMKGEGVSSVWTFASAYYPWLTAAAALDIPLEQVTPEAWKKTMMAGMGKEKDASVIKAQELFPAAPLVPPGCRKANHNRADALLMAEYLRRRYASTAA